MISLKRLFIVLAVCVVAVACNQDELNSLMSSSSEQAGVIASINEQVDNINATIEDLKAADIAIGQAVSALQDEDTAIRAQLEEDKAKIEASIDSLENYVNDKLQEAQDWAVATFATLEQYQHLCDSVAAVKQSLDEMDARITAQLKHDLDSLESSMKTWVNEQLAGYYTIAQVDAKVAALEKAIQDGDKANADAITQLRADLVKQAADLTTAYENAIAAAIEESNGVLNEKIATEISTVNTRITDEVKTINDRIDALELRIQAVEDYINSQRAFTISFTMPKDSVCFPGETIRVGYEVSESTLSTVVECLPNDGWEATVQSNENKGTITITAPTTGGNGKVVVLANRSTWTLMTTLSFDEGVLSIAKDEYPAPAEGGALSIPFSINANYGIKVAEADKSWLHYNETKSAMRNETLSLTVDANPNQSIRVGKVYIYPEEGYNDEYYELKINQASAFFSISTTGFVIGGDVSEKVITVTSSLPFNLDIPSEADWLNATTELVEGTTYKISTSFTANNGENRRTADLGFVSKDGSTRYGSIAIIQDTRSEEDISAMIFEVRVNPANNYTAALPITSSVWYLERLNLSTSSRGRYLWDVDCYIDWGDGNTEHYNGSSIDYISHQYSGLSSPATFLVKVTGKVPALNSDLLPNYNRESVISVQQWGKTQLLSMYHAFNNRSQLQSIPTDEIASFSEVDNFVGAFMGCTLLTSIPDGIFHYCKNARSFMSVFEGCTNIQSIPEGLFSGCSKSLDFGSAFRYCSSVELAPKDLFAGCNTAKFFDYAFDGCTNLSTIINDLFNDCSSALYFLSAFNWCGSLSSIPSGLFANCSSVISFQESFAHCSSITQIPEGLFSNCSVVENFSHTFQNCTNLKEIPASLFDNNRVVNSFDICFYGDSNITSESPYTIIDGNKVHLYDRINYPEEFAVASGTACYTFCNSLLDIDSIPSPWGGLVL